MGKGSPPSQPAHTTQTTTSEYPTELKPFIKDIFGKAKGIEEQRSSQGYQPYTGPRIAGFNQDQQDAFTGIRNVQGASTPFFEAQETLIDRSTQGPSAARTAQYMNPFVQNVIDTQLRELDRQGTQERQRIGAGAVGAGGFGGSRQAILEAEQMRNQGMRADDIQSRGLMQAFNQAQQAMSQADARGLQGAGMFGQMATQVPGQRLKELGALAGVGAADQTQQQRALDLGFKQFQDEYNFPMQTLNEYSSILRGFPLPANQTTNQTAYSAVAPLSSQLLGAGAGLTGMAGMAGLFGASGGQVKKLQQGGLASRYAPSNRVRMGKTNYADGDGFFANLFKPSDATIDRRNIIETINNLTKLNRTDISGFDKQENEKEIQRLRDSFAFKYGPISSRLQKEYNVQTEGMQAEEDYLRDIDRERREKYQDFPTLEGDEEIAATTEAMNQRDEVEEQREKKDTLDDRRRRMAIFGPLLKNARSIAEAPNISSALLGGLETAGEAMEGGIAADEAVIARAAALRSAALEEAKILAGITKDLSRDQLKIAFLDAMKNEFDPDKKEQLRRAAELIDDTSLREGLEIDINTVLNPYITEMPIAPAPAQKEGGPVKLAKGGTPERSFDFIPKDGKLIAVPK